MEKWEICETECFEYLKKNYANSKYTFELDGKHNSTISDILLKKHGIATFYIESKMPSAQCGQFVVLQNDNLKKFYYSPKNLYAENMQSKFIIEFMNDNFDFYKNPGTKGKKIELEEDFFFDWIYHFYSNKNVKYFIREKELGKISSDNFIIFPFQRLKKYVHANAIYRTKKSGSSNPNKNDFEDIITAAKSEGFEVLHIFQQNNYIFVQLNVNVNAVPMVYMLNGENHKYQFKLVENNIFKVTKLSNTCNANVIFDISLIQNAKQDKKDLQTFEGEFRY